jgi:hypothetical protein
MNASSERCPQCHGFKIILNFHGQSLGQCDMCEGAGTLPEHVAKWRPYGVRLKAERIRRRMTLREAANHLNMDASNLSKMERGIIAPRDIWQNVQADTRHE